jgi:hypothetical protein
MFGKASYARQKSGFRQWLVQKMLGSPHRRSGTARWSRSSGPLYPALELALLLRLSQQPSALAQVQV